MKDHNKKTSQQTKDSEDDDFFVYESSKARERFIRGLWESVDELPAMEEVENMERPPATKRHMLRMNRLFRERVGGSFLPFPEVDNFYERSRSKLVIKLKINEFFDCRKERRRAR